MKLLIPRDLTQTQARMVLVALEMLIDTLMESYQEMSRLYDITSADDEIPF
jgi:hypothetical protein